ncbi:MAG: ribonuclease H-like domain-containing protein [Thermomicrobiales bacterium]|nr:ribonuclease H-like domain-containing protein [Thermomicrobiales bacterium]
MRGIRERLAGMQPSQERQSSPPRRGVPIELLEPGRFHATEFGEVYVIETAEASGDVPVPPVCLPDSCTLYWPHITPKALQPEDVLFLDTETTGLSGGTGTHTFLVGMAYWEGGAFTLRQFFMRTPAEERALLEGLLPVLGRFKALVTFNGRTFDWPALETRFVMHGYRPRPPGAHLDLLHPARRVWKHRLASCSLANLEESLFGLSRAHDVPGFLIPSLYFDFLRDGDARRLRPVFAHNRDDVLTLVRLYDLLLRAHADPGSALAHPVDQLALGMLLLDREAGEHAAPQLIELLESAIIPAVIRARAEMELCLWLKRQRRMHDAVPILERICERAARQHPINLFAFEELAKYYEHVSRDYQAAERVVERALRLLELRSQHAGRQQLLYRLERLRRRSGRLLV